MKINHKSRLHAKNWKAGTIFEPSNRKSIFTSFKYSFTDRPLGLSTIRRLDIAGQMLLARGPNKS